EDLRLQLRSHETVDRQGDERGTFGQRNARQEVDGETSVFRVLTQIVHTSPTRKRGTSEVWISFSRSARWASRDDVFPRLRVGLVFVDGSQPLSSRRAATEVRRVLFFTIRPTGGTARGFFCVTPCKRSSFNSTPTRCP